MRFRQRMPSVDAEAFRHPQPSCPPLWGASTSSQHCGKEDVDGRNKSSAFNSVLRQDHRFEKHVPRSSPWGRQPARVNRIVFLLPHTQFKSGDWGNILRSEDGPASGSRSLIADETQSGFASAWFEKQSPGSDPSEPKAARTLSGFT